MRASHAYADNPVSGALCSVDQTPGEISGELANKVLRFGKAEVVVEKKAPENKVVSIAESKSKVAKKPVRRRRPRPESDD